MRLSRDPETRKTIRRLELQLDETRNIHEVERILRKLIVLYSELGDARGVIRCKTDLKRAEAISTRQAQRVKRRTHRAKRNAPTRMVIRGSAWKARRLAADPHYDILWTMHDLALVHLHGGGSKPFLVLQHKSWGTQIVERFADAQDARSFLIMTYGFSLKSNDPNRTRR